MWAVNRDDMKVGQMVYLAEVSLYDRETFFECRELPYRTNQSLEICTDGWLGSTNNVSRFARGRGVITREAADGMVLVRRYRGKS